MKVLVGFLSFIFMMISAFSTRLAFPVMIVLAVLKLLEIISLTWLVIIFMPLAIYIVGIILTIINGAILAVVTNKL